MEALNVGLAVVGVVTLGLGLLTGLLQRRAYLVSAPMAATLVGVAVGPHGADVLTLSRWGIR
jgi:type IV secretory pathway VirB2 component (pilin)